MRFLRLACLLLAGGCGDIETAGGDRDAGATADGGPPDARPVGSISVTVGRLFGDAQPIAGNQVVVVDSAGQVVADTTTDDDGAATYFPRLDPVGSLIRTSFSGSAGGGPE